MVTKMKERTTEEDDRSRTIILPHCTWDKFGEILANNGGKLFGLFDEMISFFSTMNMYSSSRSAVQDNREYQDFLKMFTGKAKTRETSKSVILKLFIYIEHLLISFLVVGLSI
jgi:hypothetical protein